MPGAKTPQTVACSRSPAACGCSLGVIRPRRLRGALKAHVERTGKPVYRRQDPASTGQVQGSRCAAAKCVCWGCSHTNGCVGRAGLLATA